MTNKPVRTEAKPERRAANRYETSLPLRFRLLTPGATVIGGNGITCDMSSNGILFDAGTTVDNGAAIEMHIEWPALFNGNARMVLLVLGNVIRTDGPRAAVEIIYYDLIHFALSRDGPDLWLTSGDTASTGRVRRALTMRAAGTR